MTQRMRFEFAMMFGVATALGSGCHPDPGVEGASQAVGGAGTLAVDPGAQVAREVSKLPEVQRPTDRVTQRNEPAQGAPAMSAVPVARHEHEMGYNDFGSGADGRNLPERIPAASHPIASPFWRDTLDGGNDPLNPGCHLGFFNNVCTNAAFTGRQFGDRCLDASTLEEWTNPACHGDAALDKAFWSCTQVCIQFGLVGCCTTAPIVCGNDPMMKSAYCKCVSPGTVCP